MLKEQLLALAAKAITRVHRSKKKLQERLYIQSFKDAAIFFIESRFERFRSGVLHTKQEGLLSKKIRKSSIKPAKEIISPKAEIILAMLKKDASMKVKARDELLGKKSLAYLVWALGHAERASLAEGLSTHDVSALLYRACKINLYPINISRVLHTNLALVRQAGQQQRTKTYVLTSAGAQIFREKFM